MTNLWHMSKVTHHHILGDTPPTILGKHTPLIFGGCGGRMEWDASLMVFWSSGSYARGSWPLESPKIMWEHACFRMIFGSFRGCFKNKGLVQPGATSGRWQGTCQQKEHHLKVSDARQHWIVGSYHTLGNGATRLFWVAAVALALKSKLRPLLQAQPLCCRWTLLFSVA